VKIRETVQDHAPEEENAKMAVVTAIISVTVRLANSVSAQVRLRACLHHLEISLIRPSNHRLQFQLRISDVSG
jgi:head-tail adaptor